MALNLDNALSLLGGALMVAWGAIEATQSARSGRPRRRLFGRAWALGWVVFTVGRVMPDIPPHHLKFVIALAGLCIECYSLWVVCTLPAGEKSNTSLSASAGPPAA